MKFIKKPVSVLLSLVMIVSVFTIVPFEAFAATEIEYIERSWDEANQKVADEVKTCPNYSTITSQNSLTIGDEKWYIVNGDAAIDNRVNVSGEAHLILMSGTLTCKHGIHLSRGNTLYIYSAKDSSGTLNAKTGDDEEANIGGNENENCGKFVFYGGNLKAENNDRETGAAVIGGGGDGGNCGSLSFYSGTVKTYQYDSPNNSTKNCYGAVIGNGNDSNSKNDSYCSINIYGGDITAKNSASSDGAGIGGGEGSADCPVNILGGTITVSSYNGAGIGSGQDGGSSTVTIKNADVEADSNYGAGIGSGEDSDAEAIIIENSYIKSKTIHNGGSVGSEGAGIGGGNCGKSKSITIKKSIITASSGTYGAGIGGGDESDGGDITIDDSVVFAASGKGGAGIGGGDEKGCNSIILRDSFVVAWTNSEKNTFDDRLFSDYKDYYHDVLYTLDPTINDEDAAYGAGFLFAQLLDSLIQGTHTGAGIGSGDSGNVNNIYIDNCTVLATGGACAAGIGGGDEGGFGTIDIKNSRINAQGGKYGAGIGSGDEAKKCGTINITDSEITSKGGSEGAGIGTGNEVDETSNININNSTVEARGGDLAAGIGGGDSVDSGTIKLSASTVKAFGGKDAAGIGGGEGGDGGHIEILNHSDVYAEGSNYGAGIGGGEDSGGEYCEIDSDCTVEAVSGGKGNVQSIGHGDCGWYVSGYSGGTLSLGSELKVKAGENESSAKVYIGSSRYDAIFNNKYSKIYPCTHSETGWKLLNLSSHVRYCKECGGKLSASSHVWDSSNKCSVCGCDRKEVSVTLIEQNNDREVRREITGFYDDALISLPECENVPDGYEFVCWEYDSNEYYAPQDTYHIRNGTSLRALYLPAEDTNYIDEDGIERIVRARRLSSEDLERIDGKLSLTDGWYVVEGDVEAKYTFILSGNVHFILADDSSLSFDGSQEALYIFGNAVESSKDETFFRVFGQKKQTGSVNFNRRVIFSNYLQYGGKVNISGAQATRTFQVLRGDLRAQEVVCPEYVLKGGNCEIVNYRYGSNSNVLGWSEPTDSIKINNFTDEVSVVVDDGQALTDGTNVYKGTLTSDQINAIKGMTLTPYMPHDYAEPEWVWSDDYANATAVFRCKDCDDVKEIDARVAFEDSGKNRTSTARCMFNGQEYSDAKTFQIIFDITAASNTHGTVTADRTTAKAGNRVKLEVKPDDGYISGALYYTDKNGTKTEIVDNSFKMPESDVTVNAEFVKITERVEPYIDEEGEYHLGNVEHFKIDGKYYNVDEDGGVGEEISDISLSYFDFTLIGNTYQINYYTGPTDNLTELVIPKTFNGKKITVLGNNRNTPLIDYSGKAKTQFELTLTENIKEIKGYTFYTIWVKKVKGDTSALETIGSYAFSWVNSPDGFKLDIKLDYEGVITVGSGIFNNMDVTARIKHAAEFSATSFMQNSISYIFTDDHRYGEPVWNWADDYSTAAAKFTCTDSRCKHSETVNATVSESDLIDKTVYTATVLFGGETYTSTFTSVPKGINYGGDNYINPKGTQKVSSSDDGKTKFGLDLDNYLNMQMLGIQLKNSIATEGGDDGVRFVTAVNSNLLKGSNIEDYGYIVAKINSDVTTLYNNMDKFTAEQFIAQGAADTNIFTCKGSSNSISGEFGKYSSDTDYKYVTLAVTGTSGKSGNLIARFYVKTKDGQYHYADYINGSNQTYSGMAFDLSAVSANLG